EGRGQKEEKVQTSLLVGEKLKTFFAKALRHEVRCVAREHIRPFHTSSLYGRGFPSASCLLPSAFVDLVFTAIIKQNFVEVDTS
ncbi:hypothetical protein, partial [Nostoc sp. UCD121]|uniref:hypothetical protein n=1 Tax=Nostoc sp. UCD121 TaxID=2681305 RepID=UPI001C8902F6